MEAAHTLTIHALAEEAYSWMATRKRDDGYYVTTRDDAPEWVSDLVREAHGGMLPDDWRYSAIQSALGHICDAGEDSDLEDEDHAFADAQVDTYNADRTEWLGSHAYRPTYCDEAVSDGLVSPEADIMDRIAVGQYVEAQEVWHSVVSSLTDRLDTLSTEEEGR